LSPSEYLRSILSREAVDASAGAPIRRDLAATVEALCRQWAGRHLISVDTGGAFEKGMANRSGSAIDFVVALSPDTPYTLAQIYESLHEALWNAGHNSMRGEVGIGALINGVPVDITPIRLPTRPGGAVELYCRRLDASVFTDLNRHIELAIASGRAEEVRLIKLWRDQKGFDLPSFYLELAVTAALKGEPRGQLAENVWHVLGFFEKSFLTRALVDPGNATNIVSDLLRVSERQVIADQAAECRAGLPWSAIVY
jgi:hypothetical protein